MEEGLREKGTSVLAPMTKNLLMKYTFFSLCILAAVAVLAFGMAAVIMVVVSVVVALGSDYLIFLLSKRRFRRDGYSSAVCGMIVALSSSSGMLINTLW